MIRRPSPEVHAAKQLALDRVEAHADAAWLAAALTRVKLASLSADTFTADDVWSLLVQDKIPAPHEPRALGAVFRRAQKNKLIEPTFDWATSRRPECNGRPVRVWRRA